MSSDLHALWFRRLMYRAIKRLGDFFNQLTCEELEFLKEVPAEREMRIPRTRCVSAEFFVTKNVAILTGCTLGDAEAVKTSLCATTRCFTVTGNDLYTADPIVKPKVLNKSDLLAAKFSGMKCDDCLHVMYVDNGLLIADLIDAQLNVATSLPDTFKGLEDMAIICQYKIGVSWTACDVPFLLEGESIKLDVEYWTALGKIGGLVENIMPHKASDDTWETLLSELFKSHLWRLSDNTIILSKGLVAAKLGSAFVEVSYLHDLDQGVKGKFELAKVKVNNMVCELQYNLGKENEVTIANFKPKFDEINHEKDPARTLYRLDLHLHPTQAETEVKFSCAYTLQVGTVTNTYTVDTEMTLYDNEAPDFIPDYRGTCAANTLHPMASCTGERFTYADGNLLKYVRTDTQEPACCEKYTCNTQVYSGRCEPTGENVLNNNDVIMMEQEAALTSLVSSDGTASFPVQLTGALVVVGALAMTVLGVATRYSKAQVELPGDYYTQMF